MPPIPVGEPCSRRAGPCGSTRGGSPLSREPRSASLCSHSTISAMRCATCWIRACVNRRKHIGTSRPTPLIPGGIHAMADQDNYWLRRKVNRRTALRGSALAGVGAASLALVGCGDDDDDDDDGNGQGLLPTTASSPSAAAKTPKPGGTFNFQISSPPPSLDP